MNEEENVVVSNASEISEGTTSQTQDNVVTLSDEDVINLIRENGFQAPDSIQSVESSFSRVSSASNTQPEEEGVEDFGISDMPTNDIDTPAPEATEQSTVHSEEGPADSNIIPQLSKDINLTATTSRFSGSPWFNKIKSCEITLAGLGGIGSNLAYLLGKMHPRTLYIYDHDSVEPTNIAGQLYHIHSAFLGDKKTNCVIDTLRTYADYRNVVSSTTPYTEYSRTTDIMICGFDNMPARTVFFENWLRHVGQKDAGMKGDCLLIDGRLSADMAQVLAIQGDDEYAINLYREKYLFGDEEAQEAPCSYKQTAYTAFMVASLMANILVNFITNNMHTSPGEKQVLPIFTEYDANLIMLRTEY